MCKWIISSVVLTIVTLFLTSLSQATDAVAIMKLLLNKGIITEAEYSEVMGEIGESENIEKRIERVEKKTETLEKSAAGQKQWQTHVDKHITHAEEAGPAFTNGLTIAGGVTMIGQGTSGNDENTAPGEDVIDGNISADLEISAQLGERGEAFMALEVGEGPGLEGDEINSFWGVNADAGASSTVMMPEAWYEHRFADGRVALTVGKLDLTNYFDGNEVANDETTQFLSPGFVNNIAVEFAENSAGVRLTASPNDLIDISLGAQTTDTGWEDLFEKPFLIGEVDVKPQISGRGGNYRAFVWTNRTNHTEWRNSTNATEHNYGYGVSIDQQVTDYLTLFARLGYQDGNVSEYDIAWSGGAAVSGSLWGRDDDVLGLAYGEARLSGDYETYSLVPGNTNPGNEGHFESYYSLFVNEHVSLSPDIQVVTNAQGDDDFQTVVLGAVRGQFTF